MLNLCLVRMQADATLPPAERRNYTSVFNALTTIVKTEGVPALWAGAVPTMTRATCLNMAMMISYDTAKQKIVDLTGRKPSELYVQFLASMVNPRFRHIAASRDRPLRGRTNWATTTATSRNNRNLRPFRPPAQQAEIGPKPVPIQSFA